MSRKLEIRIGAAADALDRFEAAWHLASGRKAPEPISILSFADLPLHRFRQGFHQRQTARHPCGAAVESPRQFFDRVAELFFHLGQQPALFERCFRLAVHAQRMRQ